MLYGFRDGGAVYVVAADSRASYDAFLAAGHAGRAAGAGDFIIRPVLGNFRSAFITDDATAVQLDVQFVTVPQALDRQADMFRELIVDPFSAEAQAMDNRTIEEIFGLDVNDPWDKRSDDQRQQDDYYRQLGEQAKKEGRLSGDSFAPSKRKSQAQITDIRTTTDKDGKVTIDNALGVKGLYDHRKTEEEVIEEQANEAELGSGRPWEGKAGEVTPFTLFNVKPDEFIIAVSDADLMGTGQKVVVVTMTPKVFWTNNQNMFDKPLKPFVSRAVKVRDLLDELAPGVFVVNRKLTVEEVRATFVSLGFLEDQSFIDFLNKDVAEDTSKVPSVTSPPDMSLVRELKAPPVVEEGETPTPDLFMNPESGVKLVGVRFEVAATDFVEPLLTSLACPEGTLISQDPTSFEVNDIIVAHVVGECLKHRGIAFNATLTLSEEGVERSTAFNSDRRISEGVNRPLPFSVFFRIDLDGLTINQVIDGVRGIGMNPDSLTLSRGEYASGTFVLCGIERLARKFLDGVLDVFPGTPHELYGVGRDSDRLVPKGAATVLDANEVREIGPRVWNERSSEIAAMTPEQVKENENTIKGDEFLFSGSQTRPGHTLVYIAPKSYFDQHGELYPESLDIKNLLPEDLNEIEPGVYLSKGRDWNQMSYEMARRGFHESVKLRLYLNQF